MTVTLTTTQVAERLTVTLTCASAASLPEAYIIVDGIAYLGVLVSGSYVFSYDFTLERGSHVIYGQVWIAGSAVTTAPITYVMAYELTGYRIDVYSGDAQLDALEVALHDALLPDLPTLNFSCATLLTGEIRAVIRERGLRKYQFTIKTVGISGPLYTYICEASESYVLTTAIMALQTAYGATSDTIRLLVPSLNIVDANGLLTLQHTYPQLFNSITPLDVINQLLIQALAQASVRNSTLYVFPMNILGQVSDYHMQRLDPYTGWQKDSDVYGAVVAHYTVKQFPTPDTVLTLLDAGNWAGAVSDVTQVDTTLLPVPSGAFGMLKSVGNCSRAVSTQFKLFDRIRFNWLPVTETSVVVSLQQDANNKLELTHAFAGQSGAGFVLEGGAATTDTLTKDIALSPAQYVTTVEGTTTGACSYRVILLNAAGAPIWEDTSAPTFGNVFKANVPTSVSQSLQATTVRIEFTDLYLIGDDYGVQCITCGITVQAWTNVGSHEQVVSTTTRTGGVYCYGDANINTTWLLSVQFGPTPTLTAAQRLVIGAGEAQLTHYITSGASNTVSHWHFSWPLSAWVDYTAHIVANAVTPYDWRMQDNMTGTALVTISILETIQDYAWVSAPFIWSAAFNFFEEVTLALSDFTRTGNPTNLATIYFTFSGDNYLDTLVLVVDNPLPVTVRAGTGLRAYTVTEDFGSEAGAQQYANGLLPIVSVAREQYTLDVPHSVDLGVGDVIDGDGTPFTIYSVDYRQDGKTLSAGRAMDILQTQLKEHSRRLDALERKV